MARVNLTAGRIKQFSTEAGQAFLWDTEAPGLAVRATATGNKAYIFQSKLDKQTIRVTIGDIRAWSIEDARADARRLQTLIDKGIDPRTEKADRLAEARSKREAASLLEVTVAEAWAAYLIERKSKWSERHYADHEAAIHAGGVKRQRAKGVTDPGPLAELMAVRLIEVTPERIGAWLDKETAKRPTYAALAYRLFRAFLRWASDSKKYRGCVNLDAVGRKISKDHLPKVRPKEDDCLQREQLKSWFEAVSKLGNPVVSAYLQGLLITGARREELAGLTWSDVDFQWGSLTIRDKVEGERTIPLTPYLSNLLYSLPRRKDEKGKPVKWVFSSPTAASGRIQDPRDAHQRALKAAGLPHVSLHGLRRSFGTLAEWVECPAGISAQIMGHKPTAIAEKHYRRRPLDLLRMWHSRIEAWILEQADIAQPSVGSGGLQLVQSKESA